MPRGSAGGFLWLVAAGHRRGIAGMVKLQSVRRRPETAIDIGDGEPVRVAAAGRYQVRDGKPGGVV